MRLWTVPIVVLGVTMVNATDEPSERAMRMAFETSLTAQVQSALDFVAETSGPEAVAKVREAGTDRFEINVFRKLGCRQDDRGAYVCRFAVDIGVVDGNMHQELIGRFFRRDDGLAFSHAT